MAGNALYSSKINSSSSNVEPWDIVAIVLYFLIVLAVGFIAMYRSNRGTVTGYFLAGRHMTWVTVGASLFASNIGSEHFVGLAGSGAAAGIGVAAFEFNALIILQLLGWILIPVYLASGVSTLPEFMNLRFGGQRIRRYLACLSLLLYILTKISVNMYSGALFVQRSLGWNIYAGIFLILGITTICTVTGGLTAVIYTDTLQCVIMLVGASCLSIYSMYLVGGYTGLVEKYMAAIPSDLGNSTCGLPNKAAFVMLREPSDPDLPWPGFLLGQSPSSVWYWGADQMIVQRVLAAKSLSHAQGATVFAGYLKILPLFLIVLPGMVSRVLYTDEVACVTNCEEMCGNPVSCSNVAYPNLVVKLMPEGARGIMLAVMLAALMSDLTSIFNSSATLFTIDIYGIFRDKPSEREKMIVGRLFVLVMVVLSFLWVPMVQAMQGGQLYSYIQAVAAYLSPPIASVYLLACLWPRCNEQGAFWGLMSGFFVGVVRMILDFVYIAPECGVPDNRPLILKHVHYMYFAIILFWITTFVTYCVSLLTEPPPVWRLIRTTYWTRFSKADRPDSVCSKIYNQVEHSENPITRSHSYSQFADISDPSAVPGDATRTESSFQLVGRWLTKGLNWFIGLDAQHQRRNQETENAINDLSEQMNKLNQTDGEKQVLAVNLILVLSVAVFFYVFFSVYSPVITQS